MVKTEHRVVTNLFYNWHYSNDGREAGEGYSMYNVGSNNVERIEEWEPTNGLEKGYYDVYFTDGSIIRVFNPNRVFYKAP